MIKINQIKNDLDVARKDKNKEVLEILITLFSECAIIGKNNKRETTDEEVISVIKKFIKNIDECISNITDDRINKYIFEKNIISKYLPQQLAAEELNLLVKELVDSGINKTGLIMKEFKEKYNGQYDNKILIEIIKTYLGE